MRNCSFYFQMIKRLGLLHTHKHTHTCAHAHTQELKTNKMGGIILFIFTKRPKLYNQSNGSVLGLML